MNKRLWKVLIVSALLLALAPPAPVQAQQPNHNWIFKTDSDYVFARFKQPGFAPCEDLHLWVIASNETSRQVPSVYSNIHTGVALYDSCQGEYIFKGGSSAYYFPGPVLKIDPALNSARLQVEMYVHDFTHPLTNKLLSLDIHWEGYGKKELNVINDQTKTYEGCHIIIQHSHEKSRPAQAWGWLSFDGQEAELLPSLEANMQHLRSGKVFVKCD